MTMVATKAPENSRGRSVEEIAERLSKRAERDAAEAAEKAGYTTKASKRKFKTVHVVNPYGHGVDIVPRFIDTVDAMHKRKQLDDQQYQAAKTCSAAYEVVWGQVGGQMDFDRVRGAGRSGSAPPPGALFAADIMRDVEKLGLVDKLVVEFVCVEGLSLSHCAEKLGVEQRNIRGRLSDSLTALGRKWHPQARGGRSQIRAYLPEENRPKPGALDVIEPGRTAHATSHKTYRRGD